MTETAVPTSAHRPGVGRVALPLTAYHVLVIVGGFALLRGFDQNSASMMVLGVALVGAGLAAVVATIVLTRRETLASATDQSRYSGSDRTTLSESLPRRPSCSACGWRGAPRGVVCSRCGRPTVWVLP